MVLPPVSDPKVVSTPDTQPKSSDAALEPEHEEHLSSDSSDDSSSSDSEGSSGSSSDSSNSGSNSSSDSRTKDELANESPALSDLKQERMAENPLETSEPLLNLSTDSFKSADVTLTRKFENDAIAGSLMDETVDHSAGAKLPGVESILQSTPPGVSGSANIAPACQSQRLQSDARPAAHQPPPQVIPVEVVLPPAPVNKPDPSQPKAVVEAQVLDTNAVGMASNQLEGSEIIISMEVSADSVKRDKSKGKVKKEKKLRSKSERDHKNSISNHSAEELDKKIEENKTLVQFMAKLIADNDKTSGKIRGALVKKKAGRRRKPSRFKKSKRSDSNSDSNSQSSYSSSDHKPSTSARIPRLPDTRIYQQQAMARAKNLGLAKDSDTEVAELTEWIKLAERTEFIVDPSMAYPDFDSVVGTGLPHIQAHVKRFRAKYAPIVKATVLLHLNLARDKARARKTSLGPDPASPYLPLWQFNQDLARTAPSSLSAMEFAVSSSRQSAQGVSTQAPIAVDFSQLQPAQCQPGPSIVRRHKSSAKSPTKSRSRKRKYKGKEHKRKHKSRRSEV